MRYVLAIALLILAGCESRTNFGQCVGAFDKKDAALEYKLSARNLAVGVIFFELVVPPIKVVVDETFCPVGPAQLNQPKVGT